MARVLALGFITVLFLASLAIGQVGTEGSILGTVQDATGAVVPNAQVTVSNIATGLERSATTDGDGNFEILSLPIGQYSVSVTAPGFKAWTQSGVELTVGERARIAPTLEVGQITEQVTVEATGTLLQTERSSVETVVQTALIRELPLSARNPVTLVTLVPGMRFLGQGGPEQGSWVQGFGTRENQTQFQLDGLNSNAAMDERGMSIPNVDTVAEISVATNSFSAEHGRNPLQVRVVTKSGTNEFHGALWEFFQNDNLNARNTFAQGVPKLRRHQFGAAIGGPIIENRTFFFGSFQGTPIRQDSIYNSFVPSDAMLRGDFSALSTPIRDPLTNQPFPNNQIPEERFSSASSFFLPYLLRPNAEAGRFRAIAPNKRDNYEFMGRIDHQITDLQRIYGRWVVTDFDSRLPGYTPEIVNSDTTRQHNVGLNYTYPFTPSMVLTVAGGYVRSDNRFDSPMAGTENFAEQAGIQGIGTAGREDFVGLPNINLTGYTGITAPFGVPGRLWSDAFNLKANVSSILSDHTLSFGFELDDRSVYGRHGSHSPRGSFDFNGQYTGNAFADYLLGYTSGTRRNFPLETFGLTHAPYTGYFVQDYWKVRPNLTLSLGLRYERWHERQLRNGAGATFDPNIGKVIAGVDEDGQMNLNAQPITPFLAAATEGLWIPATEAGVPNSLFKATGGFSPRLGVTWRPFAQRDVVLRAGYGLFYNMFTGNRAASSIVGPPYWAWEANTFSSQANQRWETAWPEDPEAFIQPSIGEAPAWNVKPTKTHQWNVSIQTALPFRSALTLAYVGTRIRDQHSIRPYNVVPPGQYANLQAAKPYPEFGDLNVLGNWGRSWYNGLQVKWERRFSEGLSFLASYSFSKDISEMTPAGEWAAFVPFAPEGYLRGRSPYDRTHIFTTSAIWEIPFGRNRRWGTSLNPIVNAVFGGWQLSGINNFTSGAPLSVNVPGATLGNGYGTRAMLTGDPTLSDGDRERWFNTSAFAAPPQYQWGNSGMGIFDGPAQHILDLGLMKNFNITESKYFQFRWEMFNALNRVNLGNPGTDLGTPSFGTITTAGSPRTMQLGLKFLF
jgi:Carboxypeptidase regulatory-like domain/TonB-dependent Receptor Plug Domain